MFGLTDLPRPVTRYIIGLWQRRWLIVSLGWVLALAGWVLLSFVPDRYESVAQIYLDTDTTTNAVIEEEGVRADFEKRVMVMRQQLLSRSNLEQVIRETGLDADIENAADLERKVESLSEALKIVSNVGQYFNISYTDIDPVIAQKVVQSIVSLFIEKDIGTAIRDTTRAVEALDKQISAYEQKLAEKDREIAAFRRENAAELGGNERTNRRLDQREVALSRVEDAIDNGVRRRASLVRQLAATLRYSTGNELDQLKVQLAQLQSQFNDNYPDIVALKAKISELQVNDGSLPTNPAYQRLETEQLSIDDEIAVLRQRAVRVRREIDELTLTASQVPAVQAQLQDIMRNYAQTEETYKGLLSKRDKVAITASLSEGGGTIDYKIYEAPKVAARPSTPPRGLLTLALAIVAFGASGGLAFLFTQLDKTYTQADDLEEALGLPVLGSVSPITSARSQRRNFAEKTALVGCLGAFAVVTLGQYWFHEMRSTGDLSSPSIAASVTAGFGSEVSR